MASPLYRAPEDARCGDSFAETIEVRYPYGSTDDFVQELPRIWHMIPDIGRPFESLEERVASAIEDTTVVLDAYRESGEVDANNYEVLDEILDIAAEYLAFCVALREEWEDRQLVFRGSEGIIESEAVYWLKLGLRSELPETLVLCESEEPETVVKLDLPEGGFVNYECPGLGMITIYTRAWDQYRETIEKAARQARCAQEGLYTLVAYNVNRRLAEGAAPQPPDPGRVIGVPPARLPTVSLPPAGLPAPDIPPIPPPPPEEPGWSTGKKAAVAALVVGGLAGAYWLATRAGDRRPARVTNWKYPEVA